MQSGDVRNIVMDMKCKATSDHSYSVHSPYNLRNYANKIPKMSKTRCDLETTKR